MDGRVTFCASSQERYLSSPLSTISDLTPSGVETDPAPPKNGTQEDEAPAYPKSLFLLQPLFTSHELNAVSAQAQDAVRLPEGLDLERDLVPGGGWAGSEAELLESSADEADKEADMLGQGGGAGMDELRRVIREGQKKDKRREGETPEERKARQAVRLNPLGVDMTSKRGDTDDQRRRARKERQKADPYYLGGDADSEVDEIPIVVLDVAELGEAAEAGPSDARAKKRTVKLSTGKKAKSADGKKQNMQFDRLGEMPESGPASGAASPAPSTGSTRAGGGSVVAGLAGVKLDGRDGETPKAVVRDHHRYDGADAVSPPNEDAEAIGRQQPGDQAVTGADIEVVQVKRKKKKKPVV
jgi:AP-3 complex subunit delta-1